MPLVSESGVGMSPVAESGVGMSPVSESGVGMSQTRRQFIRRCAGAAGAAAMSRSLGATRMTAQAQPLTNWAGNYTYSSPLSTATSVRFSSIQLSFVVPLAVARIRIRRFR